MPNTALNRTTQVLLTNKSGGALTYGAVVILDNTNTNGFTTTTTAGLSTRGLGVILEPSGIANNASGMVAVGGWCPQVNLNTAAGIGQFIKTHTVAGQGTPHASPQVEGDFAVALSASATPPCNLFGSPNGPLSGGSVTNTGTLTANELVVGNGSADIKVVAATNGQIPIGKTSDGSVTLATITAGAGVSVTNGAASVTIAAPGWVQLSQIITSGSQATVDFTSISGAYSSLKVIYEAQDTQGGTSFVFLRVIVNNDTTSGNYTAMSRSGSSNAVAVVATGAASALGVPVGGNPQSGNTNISGGGEVTFPSYARTVFHKRILGLFGVDDGTSNGTLFISTSRWKSTAAITRLTFTTDGTAFTNGSMFTLYGIT